jgi:membrane associated rhomboid family serine protease
MIFPISDENPTLRTPVVTYLLLLALAAVWIFVQGAGLDPRALAASVCDLGMVPGELTRRARLGDAVPIGPRLLCAVDAEAINVLTPLTSMFLHGGWAHLLGNGLFLWVFGNNVEDSLGRLRFVIFYVLCGLAAAAAQVAVDPGSIVPMVGASGAISGVLGAYLVLYPRARVNVFVFVLIFVRVIAVPAYLVLLFWIGVQIVSGLPQLGATRGSSGGVAFFAHIGGFFAGLLLVKLFENHELVVRRTHGEGRYRRLPRLRWP